MMQSIDQHRDRANVIVEQLLRDPMFRQGFLEDPARALRAAGVLNIESKIRKAWLLLQCSPRRGLNLRLGRNVQKHVAFQPGGALAAPLARNRVLQRKRLKEDIANYTRSSRRGMELCT